jgi:hypothetical protein
MCAWFIIIAGSSVAIGVLAFAIVIGAACMLTWTNARSSRALKRAD